MLKVTVRGDVTRFDLARTLAGRDGADETRGIGKARAAAFVRQ